jgi:Cu+-exporting ATPase
LDSLDKAYFKIIGMDCSSCKRIIEKQLKDNSAIKKIDINIILDSVIVNFDANLINKQQIKEMLKKSGYKIIQVSR